MIVVDASALVELVVQTPAGKRVAKRIGSSSLAAPHLVDLEVTSALRSLERLGAVAVADAERALADFLDLDVTRYAHDLLVQRIWMLRQNATVYDAAYLALGEALSAPVVTCDRKLANTPGHTANVELV